MLAFDFHSQLAEVSPDPREGDPTVFVACSTQAEVDGESKTAAMGGDDYALGVVLRDGRAELDDFYVILAPLVDVTLETTLDFTTPEGRAKQLVGSLTLTLRECVPGEQEVLSSAGAQCDVCSEGKFSFDRTECYLCDDSYLTIEPEGADAIQWCRADTIYLFPGFSRVSNTSKLIRECNPKLLVSCLGGAKPQNCNQGYTGPLCGICEYAHVFDAKVHLITTQSTTRRRCRLCH